MKTQTHKGKMQVKVGIKLPQSKEHLGLQEAGRGKEESSPRNVRGSLALPTP